jgi:hypothetical protein
MATLLMAASAYAQIVISPISDVFNTEDSSTTRTFTVADADGTVTNVTGTIPGNPQLATITTTLSGNNVTMTIVGNFNQFGTNLVEVIATDNQGFTATNHFTLGLSFRLPQLSCDFIPHQVSRAGAVLGPVPFTVHLVDTNTISQVTVRANSDNQKLIPDSNIQVQITSVDVVQQTLTGTMTVYIYGTSSGTANITLTASDTAATATSTFNVFADVPGVPVFPFPTAVTINANGPGSPYPSINTVSGLIGQVEKVTVTLFNVNAQTPTNARFLLVDPNTNHAVLLMADAGGNNPLTVSSPATLVFDDTSTNLPQNTQITSGIYKPTQYGHIAALPDPAPTMPYGTTLNVFTNINPNGDWKLWVADVGSSEGGSILSGWQLSIQTAPNIQKIKDQFTDENVTNNVVITIGDNQPGVNISVTASGDTNLFRSIVVSGSGATRTLTISPQPYKFGTNAIIVVATDQAGLASAQIFNMGVRAVAQAPVFLSAPDDEDIPAATQLGPLPFTVWSPQGSPLSVTASSPDNPTLVPSVGIVSTGSNNGTNTYALTLIPAGVMNGTATITIVASDNSVTGLKSQASFRLTVAGEPPPGNPQPISIPAGPLSGGLQQGEATPYPSVISVRGLVGLASSVKVALVGFTHAHPEDVDVLLVGPDNSTAVMLMAHAGFGGEASSLRLTFDDASTTPIPQNGVLASQSYQPADYSGGLTLPLPAPAAPYATTLSAFDGLSPNGDWNLYVLDDTWPTGGSIGGGWSLSLKLEESPVLSASQSGNILRIRFTGTANRSYGIQSTSDLVNWSNDGTVVAGADGAAEFDVSIDSAGGARFFRVVVK